jgi:hypothetical protein
MKTSGALTLEVKPSLLGQGLVTLIAGIALATVFYLRPSLVVFLVAAVIIGLLWAWRLNRFNRLPWRRVVVSQNADQIVLLGHGKQRHSGHLKRCLLNTDLLVGFSMADEHGTHRVWLFPDNIGKPTFQRLRQILQNPAAAKKD